MSRFAYEAARADGAVIRGTLEATTVQDAAALLSARGLYPVAVDERSGTSRSFWGRPSTRALATVFQGLASLVGAGVPLEPALRATERVAPSALKDALTRVSARVREGASLGSALAAEDGLFPPVAVGLVRAGERGVGLARALGHAATQLEREAETAARIRAALAYPAVVALVGTTSVLFIVAFVVPRFATLLGDLGQELPPATRVLIAMSDVLRHAGVFIATGFVALGAAAFRLIAERRTAWHRWLLTLPLVGPIRHALATARVGRTLSALLATGTPALAALAIARDAAGDAAIAERLGRARERVAQGGSLSDALGATAAASANAAQLAALGEGSGKLPALLAKAADLEEQTAERRIKVLVSLLEPALIVAFAGVVAFVAAALLQGIYGIAPR